MAYEHVSIQKEAQDMKFKNVEVVIIHCHYILPEHGKMIECSKCKKWFHLKSCAAPTPLNRSVYGHALIGTSELRDLYFRYSFNYAVIYIFTFALGNNKYGHCLS